MRSGLGRLTVVLAALFAVGTPLARATSGGTGTAADPFILTSSDTSLDQSGKYYTNTAALLDLGGVAFYAGRTVGDVHLILNTNGTTLKANSIRVGYPAGFTNYADISNGATLRASGSFNFGFNGTGDVTLHDGGNVIADGGTSFVGYNTGAVGIVRVNSGSTLTFTGSITAGYNSGSTGTITVDGSTSQMVCGSSGDLNLGYNGVSGSTPASSGTIVVRNGGTVNASSSQVMIGREGLGTVTMSTGAVWTGSGTLYVGCGAANSSLSLSGSGTRFSAAKAAYIGYGTGTGTVTIADSALVVFSSSISTGLNGLIRLNGGYFAVKSSYALDAAFFTGYNLQVYSGGSYVAATAGALGTRYFDATRPWSSDPLYATYSGIDLTGYTLVYQLAAPTVTSPTSASVAATTATLGGNITAGDSLTARGVAYAPTATNSNPQLGGTGVTNVTAAGTATGVFTVDVSSLTPETSYTYAAYATNGVGTTYSSTGTFTTSAAALAPTVTSVTSSSANGGYKAGDTVSVQVVFSDAVTVTGTPQLTLETGTTDRVVNYTGGTGSTTLTFAYTVQAGDTSTDLDTTSASALTLNGGTIKSGAVDAVLTLPAPGAAGSLGANRAIVIDTTAPTISFSHLAFSADTGGSATDFITKSAAQTITATLSGAPAGGDLVYGSLDDGSTWVDVTSKVSGTTLTWNGVTLTASGTLKLKVTDAAGNDGAVTSQAYTLDAVAPVITSASTASGTYGTAYSFTITATGSATNYGATGLPSGVSLSGATISGTPTESGSFSVALSATDAAGNIATTTLALTVAKATVTPSFTASNKTYDGTTAATITSRSLTGIVGTDDVSLTGGIATFDTKAKATGKTVTATGLGLGGTKAGYYQLSTTTATTTADITGAALTVTGITASNKPYDGNATATLNTTGAALVGKAPADAVTLDTTGAAGAFPDKVVGTGRTVTISGLAIGGADSANYTLTQPTTTANITARTLTPSITASSKAYDGTTAATIASRSLTGIVGTEDVKLSGGTASFADKSLATGKIVTATALVLSGADMGNYVLSSTTATTTADITAAPLTVTGITAIDRPYNGTTTAALSTSGAALVGVINVDIVTLTTSAATGAFASSDVGSAKPVAISGLTLAGADAPNYRLTQPTATASITAATVSLSLSNLEQVYDGEPKAVSVSASPSAPVTLRYNGDSAAPVDAGSYAVTASVSGNYAGEISGTLVIAKAPQTITFPTAPVSTSIVLRATASSGLPVTYAVVSGPATVAGSTLTITGSGNVTVRATQAGNNNYEPATADQTFAGLVLKAQTIDFATIGDRVLGSGTVTLTATATSGLPVSFAIVSGPAMLDGASLSLTGTGPVVVRASQPGDATYAAAPEVNQTFEVVINKPRIYFGDCRGNVSSQKVGDIAAYMPPTGSNGALLLVIPGSGVNVALDFEVGADGTFTLAITLPGTPSSAGSRHLMAAAARTVTVRGSLVGSTLSGTVDELGLQFSAPITPTTGSAAPVAGYYESSTLNTNAGWAASIVSAQGQVLVVASTATITTGGLSTVDSTGSFSVQAGNVTISGAVDAPTTTIRGMISTSGDASVPFSGLSVASQRNDRMINLSSRTRVGQGDRVLISGFVISGSSPKQILLRAVGPGLTGFGIDSALRNPRIRLYNSDGTVIAENDDWSTGPSAATVAGAAARVGAFGLKEGSGDAALLVTLPPGAYSAQVFDGGGTGVALSELYDASQNPQTEYQRLVNISTRGESGPGENVLIGGFIVVGNSPKKVLVRGVGPALTAFGVASALTDPRLRVYRGTELIAENDNWSAKAADAVTLAAAAAKTGAFALPNGSKDAALVLTLAPGMYTAQVGGNDADTGVALVEIYELAE